MVSEQAFVYSRYRALRSQQYALQPTSQYRYISFPREKVSREIPLVPYQHARRTTNVPNASPFSRSQIRKRNKHAKNAITPKACAQCRHDFELVSTRNKASESGRNLQIYKEMSTALCSPHDAQHIHTLLSDIL